MRNNIVVLKYYPGKFNKTESLYQYDYGQRLILDNCPLPNTYEVHFSNGTYEESKTVIGDSTGIDIPDEYLLSGKNIYIWLFLHSGENDGETVITGMIPVIKRAKPTNQEPTPVQQDVITQAIAALNYAVDQTEANVEHYPKVIDGFWYTWDEASEEWISTDVPATGEKGDPGEKGDTGATPNLTAGEASTLPAGSDVTISITGTAENPVLNIGIPKGDPGELSYSDVATLSEMEAMINDFYGGGN